MKEREGKIFNLKPELTLAMKLAATFAITYYGLMLVYEIFTLIYSRYFIDSYYFNNGDLAQGKKELWIQIIQLALSTILVFSLIQIFRKKVHGKAIFLTASLALIVFQLMVTGPMPMVKYILEVLLVLIIAPIRVKKKLKLKGGKLQLEPVENAVNQAEENAEANEASSQPDAQP